jgi:predicted nucleotidyltransferase component of viral defense system
MKNPNQAHAEFQALPKLFAEFVDYTTRQTGFRPELVEKDYFCSLVLSALSREAGERLVFKGGTCLSKVYAGFYRLSEDLDFVIPVESDVTRAERRRLIEPMKQACQQLPKAYAGLAVVEALGGSNQSTQYIGVFAYRSAVTGQPERIKVEIGLREPLILPAEARPARTLLISKITGKPAVSEFSVQAIALKEAFAEKIRAALTRRQPSIRDFFDLDHAVRHLDLRFDAQELHELVHRKLVVPGNEPVDLSSEKRSALEKQIETELKPVLRHEDYEVFDLDRVFGQLASQNWWTRA